MHPVSLQIVIVWLLIIWRANPKMHAPEHANRAVFTTENACNTQTSIAQCSTVYEKMRKHLQQRDWQPAACILKVFPTKN